MYLKYSNDDVLVENLFKSYK